jgi:dTDP-4-amino-4,6-dideoxygalactose transaminase
MGLRHQLAAYSPVSAVDLVVASASARHSSLTQLEALIGRDYAARGVSLVGSGTQALQLALGLSRRAGEARALVAAPAFTCYDVASAIIGADVDVVLYDIDPDTLGPDFDSLRLALSHGPAAAVLSPLYGIPFDWQAAADTVRSAGALIVEDAAQGHGGSWRGNRFGSLGDVSVLSFSRGKGWTGGGGGAVLTRGAAPDRELPIERAAAALKTAAVLALQYTLGRPAVYGVPRAVPALGLGETRYHEPGPVRGLSAMSAEILLRSEPAAAREAATRKANARRLSDLLPRGLRPITPHPDGEAGFLRYPILLDRGMDSFGDVAAAERLGIAPSYPLPLTKLAPLSTRLRHSVSLPGAETLARRLVTLPTHSRLGSRDLAEIIAKLAQL